MTDGTIVFLLAGVTVLAATAWYKKALTAGGAVASIIIGAVIAFAFSLYGLLLLGAFFISSTVLDRLLEKNNHDPENRFEEKGSRRDAFQVAANGGWAAVASGLFLITQHPVWLAGFIGTLAAANSDTWASAIGKRSNESPVTVLSGKPVPAGQSGGTTKAGNMGAAAGSLFIILCGSALFFLPEHIPLTWSVWPVLFAAGFAGQWIDAVSGAFLQGLYRCGVCGNLTEKRQHCSSRTSLIKGSKWVNNDSVNLICTFAGMTLGALAGYLL